MTSWVLWVSLECKVVSFCLLFRLGIVDVANVSSLLKDEQKLNANIHVEG